ncbi:beta-lactamase family protein [Pontibacter sp. KCTC 32443]|nr:serine hydrolase domain-containing protein [Pontibacter deserti]MBC5773021.1 beta-lactamase family protein [Pontibacter sp. KCTC 32443]
MKSYYLRLLLVLICISGTVTAQTKAQKAQLKQQLQAKLDSLQQANKFPGATFTVILPDGDKIAIATGIADSTGLIKMSPDHRMLSGSNGKTLFAASAMVLHEQGLFKLDDKIEKYIGDEEWFTRLPNAQSITMRMLLNHTSGIEEYYELGDFMQRLKQNPTHTWKPVEILSYIFDRKPLFEAGKGWGYADTNFILLGYILEKISGKTMYDMANTHVIKPYKLSATEPSVKRNYKRFAVGYSNPTSPFPFHGPMVKNGEMAFSPQFEWTGGGFVSSASDLATWAKGFYNFKAITSESREAITQGVPAKTGRDHLYGLGMQIRPTGFTKYSYGHSGWFPGYISDAAYFPDMNIAMGIQFNTDNFRLLKRSSYAYLLDMAKLVTAMQEKGK